MGLALGKIKIKRFADGEIYVQLQESVRGCDVYLVQPTCPPANENLMELLIMIDACRRASAKNITAVIPYFGYARADRKVPSCNYQGLLRMNSSHSACASNVKTLCSRVYQFQFGIVHPGSSLKEFLLCTSSWT